MGIAYYLAKFVKKARGNAVKNSQIHSTSAIETGSLVVDSSFNRHSFCGYDCSIINAHVGSFCSIASNVSIGGAHHPIEFASTSPVFLSHKDSVKAKFARHDYLPQVSTRIGNDVWIGEGCLIKAGVVIGDGAVIGMGAVVTRDVPAYTIYGGNPARFIRMRFDEDVVEGLLKMKWWDLPESELHAIGPLIQDPRKLLQAGGWL